VANGMIGLATPIRRPVPSSTITTIPSSSAGSAGLTEDSIDPQVFRGLDGKLYLLCTDTYGLSLIRVSPMDDPVTVTGEWHVAVIPGLSWEMFWAEGPYMVIHDDTYYLMYSGNNTAWPWYAIGYATATDPLGPYKKPAKIRFPRGLGR
jgi:GH43 family beta-xylosidase